MPWSIAAGAEAILPHEVTAQRGLTRAWLTQAQLDSTRGRVSYVLLHSGTLFVQTDQATLQAIDAETGQTLWAEEVGNRRRLALAPAANDHLVAVVNGSHLYALNRFNGKLLWQSDIDGVPGAGPAMSSQRIYVPTTSGMIYAYRLKVTQNAAREMSKQAAGKTPQPDVANLAKRSESLRLEQQSVPPLTCQVAGRALVQPIVTRQTPGEELLAWPTDRGYLFVGAVNRTEDNRFAVRYRLETNGEIVASPAYLPPDPRIVRDSGVIYVVSKDGFVHAIRERDGESLWRFPTGEPIVQPATAIDDRIYVATLPGGMYCLDAKAGKQIWWTPQVAQFVAASKARVYVCDKIGQMLILDAKNGAPLDTIAATGPLVKVLNPETDRIYLVAANGLIQCLHETEQSEPIRHLRAQEQQTEATPAEKTPGEPDTAKPAEPKKVKPPSGGGGFEPIKKPAKKKAAEDDLDAAPKQPKQPKKGKKGGAMADADAAGFDAAGMPAQPKGKGKGKNKKGGQ